MFWQNTDQLFFTDCPSILFLFQHLFIIRLRLWILGQNTEILICPPRGICRHRLYVWVSWAMVISITWPRYLPVSPLSSYSVPPAMNKYPIERYLRMLEISSFPSNSPFANQSLLLWLQGGEFQFYPFLHIYWSAWKQRSFLSPSFGHLVIISVYSKIPNLFSIDFDTYISRFSQWGPFKLPPVMV